MLVYESKNIVFCRFANFRDRFLYQIAFPDNPTPPSSSGDARYNSLAPYRVLCQHEFQGHDVSAWVQNPDNHSSDILFLRYDLISRKPENER